MAIDPQTSQASQGLGNEAMQGESNGEEIKRYLFPLGIDIAF
jgi:hypothetical protein